MQRSVVGYCRISGNFCLDEQKAAILEYARQRDARIIAIFVEPAATKRTRDTRAELQKAISNAASSSALLVFAKIGGLVRSPIVLSLLHDSGVDFVACDNASVNKSNVAKYAGAATSESRRISQKVRWSLAAYKAKGGRLGAAKEQCRNLDDEARKIGAKTGGMIIKERADKAYASIVGEIARLRNKGMSLRQIALHLNDRGYTTRQGKAWNPMQVARVLTRSDI